jgi:hypothetical protein
MLSLGSNLLDELGLVHRLEAMLLLNGSARVHEVCIGLLANLASEARVAASVVASARLVRRMAEVRSLACSLCTWLCRAEYRRLMGESAADAHDEQ